MDVLKAINLTKEYGGNNGATITTALNNFNISINSGDFTCIMGPSGSGKTTLLNILATIDEPTGNLDSKASMDVMTSLTNLNEEKSATIAMVTHDPFAASFSKRVIMIKDGKFFLEIVRSGDRQVFFKKILDSLSLLGTGVTKIL